MGLFLFRTIRLSIRQTASLTRVYGALLAILNVYLFDVGDFDPISLDIVIYRKQCLSLQRYKDIIASYQDTI